ncbi:MAG TPA: TMEM175 family protein [Trebonia sp.]|jgi:uncharacterized membrane protein|nr:TMEM175 family protein [Trebonia sp.]
MALLNDHRQHDDEPAGIPDVAASGAERVVFFSDAVVAIAITLLALALPVPAGTDGWTDGHMLHALGHHWPDYLAFFISFYVIGNHWAAHRRVFRYVNRLNHRVGTLNMLWLLTMILTPFAARLLASNGGFGVRFTIYALLQVVASASLLLISREITARDLVRADTPDSARHHDDSATLGMIVAFLVSIPVAFATEWAFAVWAGSSVIAALLRRQRAARAPSAPAAPSADPSGPGGQPA